MKTLITAREKKILLRKELMRICRIIKDRYNPQKVILFGSLSNGKVNEGSDIDLFIVKQTAKRPLDRTMELVRLTHPCVGVDFFIYTPAEVKKLLDAGYSFIADVLKDGRVLYETGN